MTAKIILRASSAQRYALCPGAYKAELGLPFTDSPEAKKGRAVHGVIAELLHAKQSLTGRCELDVSLYDRALLCNFAREHGAENQQEICDLAVAMFDRFASLSREHGGGYSVKAAEQRISTARWTGKADAVIKMADDSIWIIDWKSGHAEVDEAAENAQLRVYVALVADAMHIADCFGSIITPHAPPTVVYYSAEAVEAAKQEISEIYESVVRRIDERIPGQEQCRWCKAFGTDRCPESTKAVVQLGSRDLSTELRLDEAEKIYSLKKLAIKFLDMAEERIRTAIARGEPVSYELGKPRITKEIKDAAEAFVRLDLPEDAIFRCASLSLRSLIEEYEQASGCAKPKAREYVEAKLADIIEVAESKPPLIMKK